MSGLSTSYVTAFGHVGAYPGTTTTAGGTIAAVMTTSHLHITGTVTGLAVNSTGGMHVHTGFTCDDADLVGGHYYGGTEVVDDYWNNVAYESDAHGFAHIDIALTADQLGQDPTTVAGRAFVLHDSAGARVGCAVFGVTTGEIVLMGDYPNYNGSVHGTLVVSDDGVGGINVEGTMTGLPADYTGGMHIHTGYSCQDHDGVFGHYFTGMDDPWNVVTYTSDANGATTVEVNVDEYSMDHFNPVRYRTVVVHDSMDRIGCGTIGVATTLAAHVGAYPDSNSSVFGTVKMSIDVIDDELTIYGAVAGLPADIEGGWHGHVGFTCDDADYVGGHYFVGENDPWIPVTFESDANGVTWLSFTVTGTSLGSAATDMIGRTIVLHDNSGDRVGCGVFNPSTGYVQKVGDGVLEMHNDGTSLTVSGTVTGLEALANVTYAFDSAFQCDVTGSSLADGAVMTDAAGVGVFHEEVIISGVYGNAFIIDNSPADECETIGDVTTLLGEISPYPGSGFEAGGHITVHLSSDEAYFSAVVFGVDFAADIDFVLMSGYSCDALGTGVITYSMLSDENGIARFDIKGNTYDADNFVAHAVVINNGTDVGCTVLAPFDGYTLETEHGIGGVFADGDGVSLAATVVGLKPSTAYEIELSASYSCLGDSFENELDTPSSVTTNDHGVASIAASFDIELSTAYHRAMTLSASTAVAACGVTNSLPLAEEADVVPETTESPTTATTTNTTASTSDAADLRLINAWWIAAVAVIVMIH